MTKIEVMQMEYQLIFFQHLQFTVQTLCFLGVQFGAVRFGKQNFN